MADFYKNIPVYDPDVPVDRDHLFPKNQPRGGVPRDYNVDPPEMFAQPTDMQIIPESEWDARYDEQEASKSSLEHIYLGVDMNTPKFKNLDQNGQGYCWAYSTVHSLMITRMAMGEDVVMLSAHAVACKIKGFKDQGGWNGLSAKFCREVGCPSAAFWPLQSMSRQYDTPETWANAGLHKITEDWVDLTQSIYDQNLTRAQLATCLFNNLPCPTDFSWWSHSVCAVRWVRIAPGDWGLLILNSWLNWGRWGLGVLRGSKAVPDSALSTRVSNPGGV